MNDGESEQEFLEDFGAGRIDDSALESLFERARQSGDVELRRVLKEVRVWRYLAPLLLDRIVPAGAPLDETDALLKTARFLIRGEGAIGAG